MKNEKKIIPETKIKKSGPGSDPENKFKKGKTTAGSISNIITGSTGKTIARTGSGLANEGTAVSYEEER